MRRKDKRVPKAQQDDVVAQSGKVAERYVLVLDRELEELAIEYQYIPLGEEWLLR